MSFELKNNKSQANKELIKKSFRFLTMVGIPLDDCSDRQKEKTSMAFLSVVNVFTENQWENAIDANSITTRKIIECYNKHFEENISSGSYDDIRRKDLDRLCLYGLILNSKPNSNNNNPTRGYSLNSRYLPLIRALGKDNWENIVIETVKELGSLSLAKEREMQRMPVKVNNEEILLSAGEHNELQRRIVEDFLPLFGYGATVLYLGDTVKKHLIFEKQALEEFGFNDLEHGKLPDIIAYSKDKDWLFIIEAFFSCNPITEDRKLKLERILGKSKEKAVYVTAFLDRKTFRSNAANIAWETEVWIAEESKHMIHFNGDKFIGPHK